VRKRLAVIFAGVALAASCSDTSPPAEPPSSNPWIGTWKINLERSSFSPGPKPTVAGTIKVELSAGGLKLTNDGTDPQGRTFHTEFVGTFDGKENPAVGAATPNTTTSYKRVDDRTFELVAKVDGKPTVTTRILIAADGKTLTATQIGQDLQGQTVNDAIVADKQ
jgi:hypothetical protein